MKQWHLVQCVARDHHALEWFKLFNFPTYYPIVRELRRVPQRMLSRKKRKANLFAREIERPLLGRYVFVQFDFEIDNWHAIFNIAGVTGMAIHNGLPIAIGDSIIDGLRMREVNGAVPGQTSARLIFAAGEPIGVVDGLLTGFTGRVARDLVLSELDESAMLAVLLDTTRGVKRVLLPVEYVERRLY